ncbi:hypothetical protein Hanom_Chr13g01188181 [Helianthus anomalus]
MIPDVFKGKGHPLIFGINIKDEKCNFPIFKISHKISLLGRAASCRSTSGIIIRCQRAKLARVRWIITITTTFTKNRFRSIEICNIGLRPCVSSMWKWKVR